MNTTLESPSFGMLELDLQELESLEAPGWWTWGGRIAGSVAATAVSVGSYLLTAAAIT